MNWLWVAYFVSSSVCSVSMPLMMAHSENSDQGSLGWRLPASKILFGYFISLIPMLNLLAVIYCIGYFVKNSYQHLDRFPIFKERKDEH